MSGAVYEQDDSVGSSHDADVDAGYDDDQPATDLAAGSDDALDGTGQTSQDADVEAAYEDD
ncbi:MAG: hypothetical protein ACJ72G_10270 [Friedmanniella sp.]